MRKTIISAMLAGAALVAALPAAAQPGYGGGDGRGRGGYEQEYRGGGRDWNGGRGWERTRFDREFQQIDQRIERGVRNRQISRREADRLRRELREVRNLHRAYFRDGRLTQVEFRNLDQRIDRLERQVRSERADRDDRRR